MMKKPSIVAGSLLTLAVLAGIPATIYLTTQSRSDQVQAELSRDVVMFGDPATIRAKKGEEFTVSWRLGTGQYVIGGITGRIDFDPQVLQLVGVEQGSLFSQLTLNQDAQGVDFAADERVVGDAALVKLVFRGVSSEASTVHVSQTTVVYDTNKKNNVLLTVPTPVQIEIQ